MRLPPDPVSAWASRGAMALTGWPEHPGLGPPSPLVRRLEEVAQRLAVTTAAVGHPVMIDPIALLTERAALAGLHRAGTTSCGGGTRLLAGADGWLALSLARGNDADLVPAWLELEPPAWPGPPVEVDDDLWAVVQRCVAVRPVAELEARAVLLGLPVGVLPLGHIGPAEADFFDGLPVRADALGHAPARTLDGLVVVDLSSLWAGPLCGRILADAGATVVKVESVGRPDGARSGPTEFFDLMNAGKASVGVHLDRPDGIRALGRLVARADVVIEASRPRALEQLGFDAAVLGRDGPQVWVSITGHGRVGSGRDRVAFGDDAAIAGGLAAWHDGHPCFCADAVADPCTGLVAAAATVTALAEGGRWLLDVAMAQVSAHLAGFTLDASAATEVAPSRPHTRGRARALGADDARFLEP
jgi:CoA-transferase family III